MSLSAGRGPVFTVTEPRFWLPKVSATFHGRDIMAPVAARLSLGLDPRELGPARLATLVLALVAGAIPVMTAMLVAGGL